MSKRIQRSAKVERPSGAGTANPCRRIETIIDSEDPACPCCRNLLHRIGEDVSEWLDIVPAQLRCW